MKKIYEKPYIDEILLEEDVVRCSGGSYSNGDDWTSDNKDLPVL